MEGCCAPPRCLTLHSCVSQVPPMSHSVPLGVSPRGDPSCPLPSPPSAPRVPPCAPAPARWDALQLPRRPPGGDVVAGAVRALPGPRRGWGRGAGRDGGEEKGERGRERRGGGEEQGEG